MSFIWCFHQSYFEVLGAVINAKHSIGHSETTQACAVYDKRCDIAVLCLTSVVHAML